MFQIEKKTKSKQISFRVKEEEYNFIESQAELNDVSITDYIKLLLGKEYQNVINNNNKSETKTKEKPIINNMETEKKPKTISNKKIELLENGLKKCSKCNETKALNEFAINKTDKVTGKTYYKSSCKECNKKA